MTITPPLTRLLAAARPYIQDASDDRKNLPEVRRRAARLLKQVNAVLVKSRGIEASMNWKDGPSSSRKVNWYAQAPFVGGKYHIEDRKGDAFPFSIFYVHPKTGYCSAIGGGASSLKEARAIAEGDLAKRRKKKRIEYVCSQCGHSYVRLLWCYDGIDICSKCRKS
jgi:hypothetical protein